MKRRFLCIESFQGYDTGGGLRFVAPGMTSEGLWERRPSEETRDNRVGTGSAPKPTE